MSVRVSIVVVTYKRPTELRRALISCERQTVAGKELVVFDDYSLDDTEEMVRKEFSDAVFRRADKNLGQVQARNAGFKLAHGEFIVSLDDDAEFTDPDTIQEALSLFEDPRIGVVALPYVNVTVSPEVLGRPPSGTVYATARFTGCAFIVRRQVFEELNGFHEGLSYSGEEADFALRMLESGRIVVMAATEPLRHYYSPNRDWGHYNFASAYSNVLTIWTGAPLAAALVRVPWVIARNVWHGLRHPLGGGTKRLAGSVAAVRRILGGGVRRQAVSWRTYRLHRSLSRSGPIPAKQLLQACDDAKGLEPLRGR